MKSCCDKFKELVKRCKPNIEKAITVTAEMLAAKLEEELKGYDIDTDVKDLIKDSANALIAGGGKVTKEFLDEFTKAHIKNSIKFTSMKIQEKPDLQHDNLIIEIIEVHEPLNDDSLKVKLGGSNVDIEIG